MKDEDKFGLRMAFIICSTIIAIVALIGLFWGTEGLRVLATVCAAVVLLGMFVATMGK